MSDQILTVREIAASLRLTPKTVYAMLHEGELPGFRVRNQWRMRAAALEAWIATQAGLTPAGWARRP